MDFTFDLSQTPVIGRKYLPKSGSHPATGPSSLSNASSATPDKGMLYKRSMRIYMKFFFMSFLSDSFVTCVITADFLKFNKTRFKRIFKLYCLIYFVFVDNIEKYFSQIVE